MAITITFPLTGDQIAYTFPTVDYNEPCGYLSTDDKGRTLDGTMNGFTGPRKRHKTLKWEYLTTTQKRNLENLYNFGCPFNFVDTADTDNQFDAVMMDAPDCNQIANNIWQASVEIQEI